MNQLYTVMRTTLIVFLSAVLFALLFLAVKMLVVTYIRIWDLI